MMKSVSVDSGEATSTRVIEGGKRRIVRRRSSKRSEPEYGNDLEEYDKIRERVLQERAVVNAIDALQERWRQIEFMYDDLVELNEGRRRRRLKKLCIKRQSELIFIIMVFVIVCLLYSTFVICINS